MAHPLFILAGLLLAFSLSQAKLEIIDDTAVMVAKPGDKLELKCVLKLEKKLLDLKDLTVQWYFRGKQVVEFDKKVIIDQPGVLLSEEGLKKGDATLTILSAKEEDSGKYRCYFTYDWELAVKTVTLKVEDPNKPKEEETFNLSDPVLTRKVDKVIEWSTKFDAKMAELLNEMKKCQPASKGAAKK